MPWFDHTSSLVEAQRFLSFSISIFICFGFSCWLNQKDNIIILYDVSNIWHIPLLLSDHKAHEAIFQVLNLQRNILCWLTDWVAATDLEDTTAKENPDAYKGSKTHMGGTMRVGSRRTYFQVMDCKLSTLYGNKSYIDERHRHRYEVNPELVRCLEKGGLCFTGKDITGRRMKTPGEQTEFPRHTIVSSRMRSNASSLNPDISHREAFSAAAKNWAHFPHIHFGLMPDQTGKKTNVRQQEGEDVLMKDGFFCISQSSLCFSLLIT
ncbi:hypothetical protein G4B88_016199 [Cannabis sativa]|uniref:YABBY protein C-terminal domain-containing protein n=1 Tax=Cannabis sativa TaxID=3483 RepID=A0A7J6EYQ9_CANSA|nr:hypothetical protein G4B88_016199 [Cannabis sativa]